jgi:O-antigen/teichoic acid export membrane protein
MGGIGIAITSFIQGIILAKTLGPAQYGAWGVVLAFCSTAQAFLGFRTQEPLTRYLVEFKQREDYFSLHLLITTALLVDLFTGVLSFIVIIAAAPWMAQNMTGSSKALLLYWIYGATALFNVLDATWYCIARDQKYFKLLSIMPFIFSILQLLEVIFFWQAKYLNLTSLSIIYLNVSIVKFLVVCVFLHRVMQTKYGISIQRLGWKQCFSQQKRLNGFWRFMRTTYLSSMLSALVKNGDILTIGYLRPGPEVGWYRLAKSLVSMIQSVGGSLASVIYQDLNELIVEKNIENIRKILIKLSKIWIPIVILGTILCMLIIRPATLIIYGDQYTGIIVPFRILIIGIGLTISFFWLSPIMLAMDLAVEQLKVGFFNTLWYIPFLIIMTKMFGLIGTSLAFSLSWAAGCINFIYVAKVLKKTHLS